MPRDSWYSNALPDRPIFVGDAAEWHANILALGPPRLPTVSARARAVSMAVFHAAAVWHQMFWSPIEFQLLSWAQLFDQPGMEWLTIDLAERAVNEFFRQSITGYMLPGHVVQGAAVLLLEEEAQRGAH